MKGGVKVGKNSLITILLILSLVTLVSASLFDWIKGDGPLLSPPLAKSATAGTATAVCIDSDNNQGAAVAGIVMPKDGKAIYADTMITAGGQGNPGKLYEMSCSSKGKLVKKETKCKGSVVEMSVEFQTGGQKFTLVAAQCAAENPSSPSSTCTDSDNGADASIGGVTYVSGENIITLIPDADICLGNTIKEWSCSDGVKTSSIISCKGTGRCETSDIQVTVNGVERIYSAGSCVPQTTPCVDTDDGSREVSGSVSATDADGKTTTISDKCIDSKKLKEGVCDAKGEPSTEEITCDDSCFKGACVNREIKCQDTDKGIDAGTEGTVTNDLGASLTDSCVTDKVLLEFSCISMEDGIGIPKKSSKENSKIMANYRLCDWACTNGACVSGKTKSGDDLKNTAWCNAR